MCHEHIIDVQGVLILLIEDDLSVSHTQKNEVDVAVEPISIRHREFAFGLERNLIAVADDIDQTKAEASVCVFTISKELSEEGQSRTFVLLDGWYGYVFAPAVLLIGTAGTVSPLRELPPHAKQNHLPKGGLSPEDPENRRLQQSAMRGPGC